MMKTNVIRDRAAVLPKFDKLGQAYWRKCGKLVEAGILENIKQQKQADGGSLKQNAPGIQAAKRARGQRVAALIDRKWRFVRGNQGSWRHHYGKGYVVIQAATHELRQLSKSVQTKGYTGWFGVSKRTRKLIDTLTQKRLKQQIRKAAGRSK